jgi:hypothetical protein
MTSSSVIGSGDRALCDIVARIVAAGGIPIIKPKHGPIEWYKEKKVLVIPWGTAGAVPGGFVTDLSDELINRIIRAPKGAKTSSVLEYCKVK